MPYLIFCLFITMPLFAIDLKKYDATIQILSANGCDVSENLALALSRVQSQLRLQNQTLTLVECREKAVKISKDETVTMKKKQQKQQEEFLRRAMKKEGLTEDSEREWKLAE